jgi:serine/threonine-protein kinase
MGVVLEALDPGLNRLVAVKVLTPPLAASGPARKRFAREAKVAAAVCHEHVVTIHAVDEFCGLPYLVMEHVAGPTLQDRLDREGSPELEELLRIAMQTAEGLAAAHRQGVVHRDIKPGNILLENGVARVKITDFGLARAIDDGTVTQSGFLPGTPAYLAPEQAAGEGVDHRSDLFSLGSVLYALCTGRPPFRASTLFALLRRVSEDRPVPVREINPSIPDWLVEIMNKLHAKNPDERF